MISPTTHWRIGAGSNRRADAVDLDWLRERAREREPRYRAIADQVVDVEDRRTRAIAIDILERLEARPRD